MTYLALSNLIAIILSLAAWAYLSWRHWQTAAVWLLALLPLYLWRFSVAGVPTTWFECALYLTFISFLARGCDQTPWRKLGGLSWWLVPLAIWLAAAGVGLLTAFDTRLALGIFKAWVVDPLLYAGLLLAWLAPELPNLASACRMIFGKLSIGGTAVTVLAFGLNELHGLTRLQGIFDSPNVLAMYLVPIMLTSWLWLYHDVSVRRWWWIIGTVVITLGVGLTNSYGAWLATAVAAGVWYMGRSRQRWLVPAAGAGLLIAGLALPWVMVSLGHWTLPSHTSSASAGPTSGQVRLVLWREATLAIRQSPLLGLGLGQWQPWFEHVRRTSIPEERQAAFSIELHYGSLFPHNLWLTTWLNTGVTGLLALLWLTGMAFWRARRTDNSYAAVPLAVLAAIVTHGMVDTPLYKNDLAILFWVMIALAALMGYGSTYYGSSAARE